jgi:alpha,alpha-trehalose phosphorylase
VTRLSFGISYRGRQLRAEISGSEARYSLRHGPALEITHYGRPITVGASEPVSCPIPAITAAEKPTQPPGRDPLDTKR